jgi:hypothetical protein
MKGLNPIITTPFIPFSLNCGASGFSVGLCFPFKFRRPPVSSPRAVEDKGGGGVSHDIHSPHPDLPPGGKGARGQPGPVGHDKL